MQPSTNDSSQSSTALAAALASYEQERRPIALQNAALSIRNYHRLLDVTKQLYLDESHPQMLRQSLDASSAVLPLAVRQAMFQSLYQAALQPLAWLSDLQSTYREHVTRRLRRKLQQGAGLPLLFPRHEVLFEYSNVDDNVSSQSSNDKTADSPAQSLVWQDTLCPKNVGLKVGRRLPYVPGEHWLTRQHKRGHAQPTFVLLFRDHVNANLTSWLADQLWPCAAVEAGTSPVVPDVDTVVLVRPDDMVAAVLTHCSDTPGFETVLVQAALDSFQRN